MSDIPMIASCPFCGSSARLCGLDMTSPHWQDAYVECDNCSAKGRPYSFHAMDNEDPPEVVKGWAIEAWNERTPSTPDTLGETKP